MSEVQSKNANELGQTLGQQRIILMDEKEGRAIIEYRCGMHMCHSGGVAQGGFVTGWIDAAMAHATMAATGFAYVPMSLEVKISFFRPAPPGIVIAEGWLEQKGRSTVFAEGKLTDEQGNILAKGTSTIRLVSREKFA
jgi:uncharacterized protein (TIGR00369 family)